MRHCSLNLVIPEQILLSSLFLATILFFAGCTSINKLGNVAGKAKTQAEGILNKERIPDFNRLLSNEPPITTSFADAVTEVELLDGLNSLDRLFRPMTEMPRDSSGRYLLVPGLYRLAAKSYCIKAGTYGPSSGSGYLYAPLTGPKADILQNILRSSAKRPDILQRDVQVLLWAIIARTKLNEMSAGRQRTAHALLSAKELFELNGGALGLIPEDAFQSMLGELPKSIQSVYVAEQEIRRLLTSNLNATYEQIEQFAVLAGAAPDEDLIRPIPRGRWSYHPNGYFVRYFPSGYQKMSFDVYVPLPFQIERDDLGRIVAIDDRHTLRFETDYRSESPDARAPGVDAYRFKEIRIIFRVDEYGLEGSNQTVKRENEGWTFVESSSVITNNPSRLTNFENRLNTAAEARKTLETQRDMTGQPLTKEAKRNILDAMYYLAAIKDVFAQNENTNRGTDFDPQISGSTVSLLDIMPHFIIAEALTPDSDSQDHVENPKPIPFDPSQNVAVPANTSGQRLVSGGVPIDESLTKWYEELPDCPCNWNQVSLGSNENDKTGRKGVWKDDTHDYLQRYHPGAWRSIRWVPTTGGSGQQCTYDEDGRLINKGLGAGTPDYVSTGFYHFLEDVIAFEGLFGYTEIYPFNTYPCELYFRLHPPNQGAYKGDPCRFTNEVTRLPDNLYPNLSCGEIIKLLKELTESLYPKIIEGDNIGFEMKTTLSLDVANTMELKTRDRYLGIEMRNLTTIGFDGARMSVKAFPIDASGNVSPIVTNPDSRFEVGGHVLPLKSKTITIDGGKNPFGSYGTFWRIYFPPQEAVNANSAGLDISVEYNPMK